MNYSVLGIDQSMTATGWGHYRFGDKLPTWGLHTMPYWGEHEGKYGWEWYKWLDEKLITLQVTHLYLENTFNPKHDEALTNKLAQYGQILLADMAIVAIMKCREVEIDFRLVTVQQWREEFIGGKPPPGLVTQQRRKWLKDKSVEACVARGWMVENDNVADALGIMNFGCCIIDPNYAVRQGPLFRRAEMKVDNEKREAK